MAVGAVNDTPGEAAHVRAHQLEDAVKLGEVRRAGPRDRRRQLGQQQPRQQLRGAEREGRRREGERRAPERAARARRRRAPLLAHGRCQKLWALRNAGADSQSSEPTASAQIAASSAKAVGARARGGSADVSTQRPRT